MKAAVDACEMNSCLNLGIQTFVLLKGHSDTSPLKQ